MGVLTHNRGSRELGGDYHPQTVAWASRMLAANYQVTAYQKNVHTKFCNKLKEAGVIDGIIQFIVPVWESALPNMVSVLTSNYTASIQGALSHSPLGVKPTNNTSYIRSGLESGNWPSGLSTQNSGQLYYTVGSNNAFEFDMGARNYDGVTAQAGLVLGNAANSVNALSGTSVNPILYGAVASESEHLLCFNSSPEGQRLMKQITPGTVANIGSVQPIGTGTLPDSTYPFCALNTVGTGIQLNTLGRYHKAFMLFKDATNSQAALICSAVYNFVNTIIPAVFIGSYISYNGINLAYNGADILFTNITP
ncbi:hypothetical protein UFOVP296_27 [uncultured Caudovirales phage]|uniref:Uncharacterized protein n=1 Tax=uncultured Caudovirales phage TaxID=2100421 RepID=A0A6J5PQE8_9CAUD|nr:hypothetical protein UFOVP296_27 [uncultured Caudovirales phage]CAB4169784.1 hypothetical protein UFOVP912_2 [uncultured Caudovirales phage]CAB4199362.1 hypothetical protein UFOVP1334_34 [uncultured Caudovirales phage]